MYLHISIYVAAYGTAAGGIKYILLFVNNSRVQQWGSGKNPI